MMKNESGRSMVEMLGVLAIIGVLSVGGIAGYTMAMKKYKANNLVDCISKMSIQAQVNATTATAPTFETVGYKASEIDNCTVTATNVTGEIKVSGCTNADVCNYAKDLMGNNVGGSGGPAITWTCSATP